MNRVSPNITLVHFNLPNDFHWPFGKKISLPDWSISAINHTFDQLKETPGFTLFWDFSLGLPPVVLLPELIKKPRDIWHGGHNTAAGNYDPLFRFANPCWMLNLRLKKGVSGVSWRIDFRCALFNNKLFEDFGGLDERFETLHIASLEFGYRCLRNGAIPIFEPQFAPDNLEAAQSKLPTFSAIDHILFAKYYLSPFWASWAIFRGIMHGELPWEMAMKSIPAKAKKLLPKRKIAVPKLNKIPEVSVLIITLGRYQYISTVIDAMLRQSISPKEIIVVDATLPSERKHFLEAAYAQAPALKIIYSETVGQCTQRNIGLQAATGESILFLDDDMAEIPNDHLEKHLKNLEYWQADASCGCPDEVGAPKLDRDILPIRVSDVFPAGDSMIRRSALDLVEGFDPKIDKGVGADHDFGTRLYQHGALILLDPALKTLHLKASSGGLRTHGSRVVTFSSSRKKLLHRRLPHVTEIYSKLKYFPESEVRESLILSVLGTFILKGAWYKKALKVLISFLVLPATLLELHKRKKLVERMIS